MKGTEQTTQEEKGGNGIWFGATANQQQQQQCERGHSPASLTPGPRLPEMPTAINPDTLAEIISADPGLKQAGLQKSQVQATIALFQSMAQLYSTGNRQHQSPAYVGQGGSSQSTHGQPNGQTQPTQSMAIPPTGTMFEQYFPNTQQQNQQRSADVFMEEAYARHQSMQQNVPAFQHQHPPPPPPYNASPATPHRGVIDLSSGGAMQSRQRDKEEWRRRHHPARPRG